MNKKNRLIEWFLYEDLHRFHNFIAIITKRGYFFLNNGYKLAITKKNYFTIIKLYYFTLKYGVELGEEEGCWRYKDGIIITPDGIKFSLKGFNPSIFFETFINDYHYVSSDLKGKTVINAGGFVGDTALYFAEKGADVFSFEPDPNSYELAIKNIELNPSLSNKIVMRNWALGLDKFITFPVNGEDSGSSSALAISGLETVSVRCASVSTILKEFDISEPFLLDLDVKGFEYEVIKDPQIANFNIVRIEYNTKYNGIIIGTRSLIIGKLKECGFRYFRIYSLGGIDLNQGGVIEARR